MSETFHASTSGFLIWKCGVGTPDFPYWDCGVGTCLIWKVVFFLYLLIFDLCFSRFGDAFGEVAIRAWLLRLVALALRTIFENGQIRKLS